MTRPFITSRWYQQAQATHDADLAKPQRFPLTGDGLVTERIIATGKTNGPASSIGSELAAARYRDWEWHRRQMTSRELFVLGRSVSHAIGGDLLRPSWEQLRAAAAALSISMALARRALDTFNFGALQ